MKQTAVEWLESKIYEFETIYDSLPTILYEYIQHAKVVEKQQIIEARQDGYESTYNSCESGCMGREILEGSNEQYYENTFKNEK